MDVYIACQHKPRRDPALELAVLEGADKEESEMRLIDADRLLKKFNIDDITTVGENHHVPILIARKAIEDAPTIIPAAANWTPCADGLPTKAGIYLITYGEMQWRTKVETKRDVCRARYTSAGWTFSRMAYREVIARQTLPESYDPDQFRDSTKKVKEPFIRSEACQRCEDNEKCLWDLDAICHCCKPKKADNKKAQEA